MPHTSCLATKGEKDFRKVGQGLQNLLVTDPSVGLVHKHHLHCCVFFCSSFRLLPHSLNNLFLNPSIFLYLLFLSVFPVPSRCGGSECLCGAQLPTGVSP